MKPLQYFFIPMLSAGLLFGCDSNTEQRNTTAENTQEISAPQPDTAATPAATAQEQPADPDLTQVEVVAANLQFSPNEIKAKPGERLQVTLVNNGDVPYSIKFELPDGEQELREPVPPGRKAALIFTAPEKAGTYAYYSPMTNQRGRGVSGNLIVEK